MMHWQVNLAVASNSHELRKPGSQTHQRLSMAFRQRKVANVHMDPALSRALDKNPGGVSFIVLLRDEADLGAAAKINERTARAQAVASA